MAKQNWKQTLVIVAALVCAINLSACNSKKKPVAIRGAGDVKKQAAADAAADSKATPGLTDTLSDELKAELDTLILEKSAPAVGAAPATQAGDDLLAGGSGSLKDGYVTDPDDEEGGDEDEDGGGIRVTVTDAEHIARGQEGYKSVGEPLLTGATDLRDRFFTDGKDDVVIRRLVGRANHMIQLDGRAFFNDSMDLATRLSNVDVNTHIGTGRVDAMVEFIDGDKNVKVVFAGRLSSRNQAPLQQIPNSQLFGQANDYGYQFKAYLTCIDASEECKNTILVIEHIKNGEICKRIFIVHRFGNGRMILSDADYVNAAYFPNPNQRAFMLYLSNTVHLNRYILSCQQSSPGLILAQGDGTCEENQATTLGAGKGFGGRVPFAHILGYRTWAAAYGASFFDLFFREEFRPDRLRDVLHIQGPLLLSQGGPAYDRNLQVKSYLESREGYMDFNSGATLGDGIHAVRLLDNNGLGTIKLGFVFKGSHNARSFVEFNESLDETRDPISMSLYPAQPRGEYPLQLQVVDQSEITKSSEASEDIEAVEADEDAAVTTKVAPVPRPRSERPTEPQAATSSPATSSGDIDETETPPEG